MRDFFRGWRRKMGCGVLSLAVALMVEWVRAMVFRTRVLQPGMLNSPFDEFIGVEFGDQLIMLRAIDFGIEYPIAIGSLTLLSALLLLWPQRKRQEPGTNHA